MHCPECRFDNPREAVFCCKCGNKIDWLCHECGYQNPTEASFCCKCGRVLFRGIDSVDDKKLAGQINQPSLESGIKTSIYEIPDSERKCVTVMFSDLTGYTEMSEKLDPEEVKEITSTIFFELTKIIEKYDGFIEKYIGDAIFAVFGAQEAFEDGALRAIKAAREIHTYVKSISPKYENLIGRQLFMHTGINTGLVVTGEINYQKGTHGLVGDTINTAARLMSASQPGEIITDHDSYAQTKGYFEFEPLAPIKAKGKSELIQIYRVGDALPVPKKLHRLHGRRADLIGRSIEMQVLMDSAESLEQGKGSIVAVCGTAGTGKSRLVHEFKKTVNLKKIQWFDGNAYPYTENTPYFPLIDLLTNALNIEESDNPEVIKHKVESGLEALLGKGSDKVPYIGGLFSIEYPETSEVSPEYWKNQLYTAMEDVLKALLSSGPTVICLEDMHWADPSTMELIQKLISNMSGPLLVICIYRPLITIFTDFEIQALNIDYTELRLRELSPSESQEMVCSLLNADKIPKELSRFIRDNIEGNPFYVEELINSLIDSEALSMSSGKWQITKSINESFISTSIQGVIAGRIDRLGNDTKRILQEASVIGRAFLFDILKRISEIKENIDRNLVVLERLDLISAKSIQPTLEYIFKHALTQEIVYNGLIKSERQIIHDKIGGVIEIIFQDRLSEFYESLAYHYERGSSKLRAVKFLIKAGEKSLGRFSLDESDQYFNRAYEIVDNLPEKTEKDYAILFDLLNRWGMVFYYRGNFENHNKLLNKYKESVAFVSDQEIIGMFYAWCGLSAWTSGNLKDAFESLNTAKEIGNNLKEKKVKAYALTWLSWLCGDMGLFSEGIRYGQEANLLAQEITTEHYLIYKSLGGIGYNHFCSGQVTEGIRIGQELLDYGNKYSHVRCLVIGHMIHGGGCYNSGDFASAITAAEKGYKVALDPFYSAGSLVFLLLFYLSDRQMSKINEQIDKLVSYCTLNKNEFTGGPAKIISAINAIDKGEYNKGMEHLQSSIDDCRERHRYGILPAIELALGNLFLEIAKGDQKASAAAIFKNIGFVIKHAIVAGKRASEHFNAAIHYADQVNAIGLKGQAYYGLGILNKIKRKYEIAGEYLEKSIDIFQETGAYSYLDQAENELGNLPQKTYA